MDKTSHAARNGPISVEGVAHALQNHVTVSECGVFAHLGREGEVVVLILPKVTVPTFLQVGKNVVASFSCTQQM